MGEPLSIDTDGVRSLGDIHGRVAASLGSLAAGTPESAGVASSHGTIADAVNTALTAALGSRSESITATGRSAETLSALLHQAALAYEHGDQRGEAAIEWAADAVPRDETPTTNG
nr:ESX-1 secretion-associated protein [Actinomycetes bacterium]